MSLELIVETYGAWSKARVRLIDIILTYFMIRRYEINHYGVDEDVVIYGQDGRETRSLRVIGSEVFENVENKKPES